MHEATVGNNAALPGRSGQWSKRARDQRMVVVTWTDGSSAMDVEGNVSCDGVEQLFTLHLTDDSVHGDSKILGWDGMDVTLTLTRSSHFEQLHGKLILICNVPLTSNSFFDAPIGAWPAGPDSLPNFDADAADSDIGIEGPQQAVDLFPFVWLHPAGGREMIDIDRGYISLERLGLSPPQLDLYNELAARTGPGAATAKQADAAAFRHSGYQQARFIDALAALPPPLTSFPKWRAELERNPATIPDQDLELMACLVLGQPPADFLKDSSWMTAQSNIWQSLFALALVGTLADAVLAVQLTDVLRIGHFLQLLVGRRYSDLGELRVRRLVLGARPVFPDEVAAFPPAPAIAGPAAGGSGGNWEVLGVGTLKIARQRLSGYLPGELAEVVNVMPRERQEVQERYTVSASVGASDGSERESHDHNKHLSSASNELIDAVQEAMAAEGVLRNLNNVQPAYNNLNLTLNGAAADGKGESKWAGNDASRYLQQVTEQAVRQLGERVSRQRGSVWREFRERRQSNLIDNTGNGRLVGVYRWVDRVMRVHLEEAGQRLVLSFLIEQPAAAWLAKIEGEGALALQKPVPLEQFAVAGGQGYAGITAEKYQAYGASYGLCDMTPPPPLTLTVSASYDRVGAAAPCDLRIPDGYLADAGRVTIGLADDRYNLMCSIAGVVYSSPAVPPSPELDTAVPISKDKAVTIDPAKVSVPVMPTANVSFTKMTEMPGASGVVQVTLMTAAPAFVVQVDLECKRDTTVKIDQEMVAWQILTYERLLKAYQLASHQYAEGLAARIAASSAGHTGEVQRNALRQACLELLAPGGDTDPQQFRFFDPMLSWAAMSWHYEPWHAGSAGAWPERAVGEKAQPQSSHVFDLFLRAPSARVLLPVEPGCEAWLLYYLQYGQAWAGGPTSVPVTSSCVLLLEEIHGADEGAQAPREPDCPRAWTVRVPTSMLYLQSDASLPSLHGRDGPSVPPDRPDGSTI